MFKPLASSCILSCALLVPLSAYAAPSDPIALVNDKTITQQDYDNYISVRAKQTGSHVTPNKQTLIDELVQRELLRQDAFNKKLDTAPEFIKKIGEIRDNLLMAMAIHDYLDKHPLDDAMLKNEYDLQIAQINTPTEYQVKHILVKSETDANAIIAELVEGKAFAELAKAKSTDSGSAKKGGNLGWIKKSDMVPEFGAALEKLEKGKYTPTPVKSEYGWHIIQLDYIRTLALPSFESVKDKIRTAMQGQQMQQYVNKLKKLAKISVLKK